MLWNIIASTISPSAADFFLVLLSDTWSQYLRNLKEVSTPHLSRYTSFRSSTENSSEGRFVTSTS